MKARDLKKDYLKANRKGSREAEIESHGHPVNYTRVHPSKKVYNRKKMKAGLRNLPDFLKAKTEHASRHIPLCHSKVG